MAEHEKSKEGNDEGGGGEGLRMKYFHVIKGGLCD